MTSSPSQPSSPPTPRPSAAITLLASLLLFIAAFALYANSLSNPFIIDDALAIQQHPDVLHVDGVFQLWFHDYWDGLGDDPNLYRPVTILSYSLNRILTGGLDPASFRIVNVALLALLASLFFAWLSRHIHPAVAWTSALLFVIHPSNTEVINHVVGRADLLSLTGIFAFLLLQSRSPSPWRIALATLAALVAFGSKESGLVLIALAITNHFLLPPPPGATAAAVSATVPPVPSPAVGQSPNRQPAATTPPLPGATAAPVSSPLIPALCLFIPLLLYILGRFHAVGFAYRLPNIFHDDLTGNPLRGLSFSDRLPAALSILAEYFRLTILPLTAFNHIPATLPAWSSPLVAIGVLLLLGLIISQFLAARSPSHRWLLIPLLLALFHYLIVGNLLVPTGVYVANRLSLPFTLCTLSLLAFLADRWIACNLAMPSPLQRKLIALCPVAFAFPLLLLGVVRANKAWSSELNRMQADLIQEPSNPVAKYHLGVALTFAEKYDDASDWLTDAVNDRPDSLQARMALASVYLKLSPPKYHDARVQYAYVIDHRQVATKTTLGLAYKNLGAMSLMDHQFPLAQSFLDQAYKATPNDPDVLYNLGQCAEARGKYLDAIKYYDALFVLAPHHEAGRKAYEDLKAALSANP